MPDLAIAIGNTRIKAGVFEQGILISTSAQPHNRITLLEQELGDTEFQRIAIASVVPTSKLITIWHDRPQTQIIVRSMIPLTGIYKTMGLDRALTGYAACVEYAGFPVLVIDCGTAITLTGIDGDRQVIGGAILAGLTTQLKSLNISTAALPLLELPQALDRKFNLNPLTRWATDTNTAIYSGLIYTVIAGIQDFVQDWRSLYPDSKIIFTGGDSELILQFINIKMNAKAGDIFSTYLDPNLILKGIAAICLI
jgi:type III pantothenate kinase